MAVSEDEADFEGSCLGIGCARSEERVGSSHGVEDLHGRSANAATRMLNYRDRIYSGKTLVLGRRSLRHAASSASKEPTEDIESYEYSSSPRGEHHRIAGEEYRPVQGVLQIASSAGGRGVQCIRRSVRSGRGGFWSDTNQHRI